ncbi:MAG: Na/Pi cotransporter family protein, partial [Clostridia bacterium]|nr:Na/Pi cotransporter family protein [Clostridia bacterium]
MDVQQMIFSALGGLGMFLFGIHFMSEGLQLAAGDRLRVFLEAGTKTPIRGIITGIIVTALIQSSSGTTVITVGLVNAGLLSLRQAIGIIMGANIGTTVTAYLIGISLEEYSLPMIAVGIIMLFFIKNKRVTNIGQIICGFGMLFYGMGIMGEGLSPLKDLPFFANLMLQVQDHAILGVAVGTVFTMLIQSSAATIGIIQELASQGAVSLYQSIPLMLGSNIGTTITALLACIGASVAARRTAVSHTIFNLIGAIIFTPLLIIGVFIPLITGVTNFILYFVPGDLSFASLNIKMQIAQAHGIFNIINTLVLLPFVGLLAKIVTRIIPEKPPIESEQKFQEAQYLEPRLLVNPAMALGQARQEILYMGQKVEDFLHESLQLFYNLSFGEDTLKDLAAREEQIDKLEENIIRYLVKLSSAQKISQQQSEYVASLTQLAHDLERIGDHADNVVELAVYGKQNNIRFSKTAEEHVH